MPYGNTQAISGYNTRIKMNGVEVAEVSTVAGPGLTRETIDASHMQSPEQWREFIKGMKDAGELSFDVNMIPGNASQFAILSDFYDDTSTAQWELIFPNAASTTWSFRGILTTFEPTNAIDEKLSASITIKLTGKPTLA